LWLRILSIKKGAERPLLRRYKNTKQKQNNKEIVCETILMNLSQIIRQFQELY
jgi:hypothetical protein